MLRIRSAKPGCLNWVKEHGIYRLELSEVKSEKKAKSSSAKKTTSKSKNKKKGKNSVSFEGFYGKDTIQFNGGLVIPSADSDSVIKTQPGFTANASFYPGENRQLGVGFNFETKNFGDKDYSLFGGNVIYRLPLDFNLFCISPKVLAGVGIGRGEYTVLQAYAEAAIETIFDFGIDYIRPGFEIGYKGANYTINDVDKISAKNGNLLFKVVLGINFD